MLRDKSHIKEILTQIKSDTNLNRIKEDSDRYCIYNGKLKEIIREAIQKEFLLPETVKDMAARIIPINITQKIITKLAKVYISAPKRKSIDGNEDDQDALDFYVTEMDFNRKMNHSNNMFKLHKHVSIEPFIDSKGKPKLRILPSQTYSLFSDDKRDPTNPTVFIKHIKFDIDLEKEIHEMWTDEDFVMVNGNGEILIDQMMALNNPEGINPYGVIPFTIIRDSDDLLIPIMDDDLKSMQIAINLLLTDLAFATKYASWSIFYTIGVGTEKISFNPNSVIALDHQAGTDKPEIGTIKSELDSDAMLRQVEALVSMLLSTKGLSVGTVSGQIQANNATSGIAKILDQAETIEDREVQASFFEDAEKEFWFKFAHNILPVWMESGEIDKEYAKPFSQDFELSIIFPEQKVMLSKKEHLELIKQKLEMGLMSFRDAVKETNPELSDLEIDDFIANIQKEKLDNVKFFQRNMQTKQEPDLEDDDGDIEDNA